MRDSNQRLCNCVGVAICQLQNWVICISLANECNSNSVMVSYFTPVPSQNKNGLGLPGQHAMIFPMPIFEAG